MQARRGGEVIHRLFYLFILAHESKYCRPPPLGQPIANDGCHTVETTGEEGGGGCIEMDTAPGIEGNKAAL